MSGAVLITGAGARLGKVMARGLANDEWEVAIHYNRSESGAQALAEEINAAGGKAVIVQANLNIPSDVESLITRAATALGRPLSALINNASTFHPDHAHDFTHALFDHHMDINLRAPLRLSQNFAAQCTGDGVIINMVDQRVLKPNPLYFTYSMSKSALYWATKTMAQALAPNIRVCGVGPGPTLQNTQQSEDDFAAEAQHTLLQTTSSPDAILGAVRYLLTAKSVTGQMLAVDSGQHLTWKTQDLLAGETDDA